MALKHFKQLLGTFKQINLKLQLIKTVQNFKKCSLYFLVFTFKLST